MSATAHAKPGSQGTRNISGEPGAEKMRNSGMICISLSCQLMHKLISMIGGMIRGQMKRTIAMLLLLCVFAGGLFAQEYSHIE